MKHMKKIVALAALAATCSVQAQYSTNCQIDTEIGGNLTQIVVDNNNTAVSTGAGTATSEAAVIDCARIDGNATQIVVDVNNTAVSTGSGNATARAGVVDGRRESNDGF